MLTILGLIAFSFAPVQTPTPQALSTMPTTLTTPLQLEIKVEEGSTLRTGPLVVKWTVKNTSKKVIAFLLPKDWWQVSVTGSPKFMLKKRVVRLPETVYMGSGGYPIHTLAPDKGVSGEVVLSQDYELKNTGVLTVAMTGTLLTETSEDYGTPILWDTVHISSKPIKVKVKDFSRKRLREIAEQSYKRALASQFDDQKTAIQTLFDVPEEIALDLWAKITDRASLEEFTEVGEQLFRISSRATLELMRPLAERKFQEVLKYDLQAQRELAASQQKEQDQKEKDASP